MTKSVSDVAKELCDSLVRSGQHVMTFHHEDLYEISGRTRIKGAFIDDLTREIEEIGHIFAKGDKVYIIAHDTNFSPVRR